MPLNRGISIRIWLYSFGSNMWSWPIANFQKMEIFTVSMIGSCCSIHFGWFSKSTIAFHFLCKHPVWYIFFQLSGLINFRPKLLQMINDAKIRDLIQRKKETGLKITDFCTNEGIPKSSFYYWRKKIRKGKAVNFIPLLVKPSTAPFKERPKNLPSELNNHPVSGDDFLLELIYLNGTRLRIKNVHDLEHIRNLVTLFG